MYSSYIETLRQICKQIKLFFNGFTYDEIFDYTKIFTRLFGKFFNIILEGGFIIYDGSQKVLAIFKDFPIKCKLNLYSFHGKLINYLFLKDLKIKFFFDKPQYGELIDNKSFYSIFGNVYNMIEISQFNIYILLFSKLFPCSFDVFQFRETGPFIRIDLVFIEPSSY